MNLADATTLANGLVEDIRHCCIQAEVAGSIRRRKSEVKDIECVVIPRWYDGPPTDMFSKEREKRNSLYEYMREHSRIQWIKPGTPDIVPWTIKPDGKYWRGLVDGKIKLDLFLTTPENFGIIFLIRTGPSEFSHKFVTRKCQGGWLPNDYKVEDGHLKRLTGEIIPSPDEETVFRLAGMKYIAPEDRV